MHVSLMFSALLLLVNIENVISIRNKRPYACILDVSNDGPVTLDIPLTVNASLKCINNIENISYVFEDDTGRTNTVIGKETAATSFIFSDLPGRRSISVSAYTLRPRMIKVASETTHFNVHEYIPGDLEFSNIVLDNGIQYASTRKDTNISLHIRYPQRVLQEAEFTYSWTIGKARYITGKPFKVHRFKNSGSYWIHAAVVARIPIYDGVISTPYKWGYFEDEIVVKDPFSAINITGNTYLQHGQLLNLDISCNGSGPVNYCWKVLPQTENKTNLSCIEPVSGIDCSFPIIYYFRDSGNYLLAIYIDNIVTSVQRNIEIHIYDVSLSPQLSTVIIPVVCTVLVLLIVATAVVMHIRRHPTFDIETADFDFMRTDEPNTIVIETSWELMRRSLLQLLRIQGLYYSSDSSLVNYGAILRRR